jgi:Ca2+-binding EF-hand superfamily protein
MGALLTLLGLKNSRSQEHAAQVVKKRKRRLIKNLKPLFGLLHISEPNIDKLYNMYAKIDGDQNGTVSSKEYFEFFHIHGTSLVAAIFFKFNLENKLTFPHFILMMFYLCVANEEELATIVFHVYDVGNLGKIFENTVKQVVIDMYGKSYRQETHATAAIVKLINLKDKDYGIGLTQFLSIITLHLGPFVVFQKVYINIHIYIYIYMYKYICLSIYI